MAVEEQVGIAYMNKSGPKLVAGHVQIPEIFEDEVDVLREAFRIIKHSSTRVVHRTSLRDLIGTLCCCMVNTPKHTHIAKHMQTQQITQPPT